MAANDAVERALPLVIMTAGFDVAEGGAGFGLGDLAMGVHRIAGEAGNALERFVDTIGGGKGRIIWSNILESDQELVYRIREDMVTTVESGNKIRFNIDPSGYMYSEQFVTENGEFMYTNYEIAYLKALWGTVFNKSNVIWYGKGGGVLANPPWVQ